MLPVAWAGLGYLSLYLAGKMHLFDRRGHAIKAWIAFAPLIGATLIAVSRTMGELAVRALMKRERALTPRNGQTTGITRPMSSQAVCSAPLSRL